MKTVMTITGIRPDFIRMSEVFKKLDADFNLTLQVSGVYCIKCDVNNKMYVGSSFNMYTRIRRHFNELRNETHVNSHLQRAFLKYGEDHFYVGAIEVCTVEQLISKEQEYLDVLKTCDEKLGYNIVPKADQSVKSLETRKRISAACLGRRLSEATRQKISQAHAGRTSNRKGIVMSSAQKQKISEATKGEKNPFYGKTHSAETLAIISENSRKLKHSEESKRLMSEKHKGKKFSLEHRQKLRESNLRRWAKIRLAGELS